MRRSVQRPFLAEATPPRHATVHASHTNGACSRTLAPGPPVDNSEQLSVGYGMIES
jgi:hypothetical protein